MLSLVKRISGGLRGSLRATLGPPHTWDRGGLWKKINAPILPIPFGAYVALRVGSTPGHRAAPLYLPSNPTVTRRTPGGRERRPPLLTACGA